jgi:hypothetical protein
MEIIQSHYPSMLLCSLLVGVSLSAVWDIFRIIHIALSPISCSKSLSAIYHTAIFISDLAFALISTFACTVFTFYMNDGRIRLITLLSIAVGFFIYRFTVGRVIMFLSDRIISFIYKVVRFVFMHTLYPVFKLIHHLFLILWEKAYSLYLSKASSRGKKVLLAMASRGFLESKPVKVKNTRNVRRGKAESQDQEKNEYIS